LRRPHAAAVVEVEGAENLAEAARSGKFLLVGAHLGHWELIGCYAALAGYPMAALYTPERNGWIDAMIRFLRRRGSAGSKLIARGPNAVRQMMDVLKKGHGLFIIVDQRVDDGAWVRYFGKLAQTRRRRRAWRDGSTVLFSSAGPSCCRRGGIGLATASRSVLTCRGMPMPKCSR
jgi:KDO2-lipid IV(A) lauroyltransferase